MNIVSSSDRVLLIGSVSPLMGMHACYLVTYAHSHRVQLRSGMRWRTDGVEMFVHVLGCQLSYGGQCSLHMAHCKTKTRCDMKQLHILYCHHYCSHNQTTTTIAIITNIIITMSHCHCTSTTPQPPYICKTNPR